MKNADLAAGFYPADSARFVDSMEFVFVFGHSDEFGLGGDVTGADLQRGENDAHGTVRQEVFLTWLKKMNTCKKRKGG
ncbi:MAG: hypothetical protein LBT53_02465 [Puniceicoccales bacterium]|nr:hypothetical protein [Puniceicoccales bacterium]